jgi:Sigma-70 region 2
VYRIARRMLPDADGAEDVTRAAFLKLWTNPGAFRGGHFSGWLGRVARNCLIDALRCRAVRREAIAPAADRAFEARIDDLVLFKLDGEHVRRALEPLPPQTSRAQPPFRPAQSKPGFAPACTAREASWSTSSATDTANYDTWSTRATSATNPLARPTISAERRLMRWTLGLPPG